MNQIELMERPSLQPLIEGMDTSIAKDLKINLKRLVNTSSLDGQEVHLVVLALARASQHEGLEQYARQWLVHSNVSESLIREAVESAALMAMLTTYYRFRHMLEEGVGSLHESYQQAGLRMTALARPDMGKRMFEMLAFSLAVVYGCPSCVVAHEQALLRQDVARAQIHDLARLAAVVKGLATYSDGGDYAY